MLRLLDAGEPIALFRLAKPAGYTRSQPLRVRMPLFSAEHDSRSGFWVKVMLVEAISADRKDSIITVNSASPRLVRG